MKKREAISKIMTKNLLTVNTTQSLHDVAKIMEDNNVRHVPVVSGNKLIGMISHTDIQRISFVDTYGDSNTSSAMYDVLKIEQVMTRDLISLEHTDNIYDAAKIFSENNFNALPVLDNEQLVGIVTTEDLIKYLLSFY